MLRKKKLTLAQGLINSHEKKMSREWNQRQDGRLQIETKMKLNVRTIQTKNSSTQSINAARRQASYGREKCLSSPAAGKKSVDRMISASFSHKHPRYNQLLRDSSEGPYQSRGGHYQNGPDRFRRGQSDMKSLQSIHSSSPQDQRGLDRDQFDSRERTSQVIRRPRATFLRIQDDPYDLAPPS